MHIPEQDIRITKTHMALVKSLKKLLNEKPFKKITVSNICQDSMVGRSTFYLHFEDKYQLLSFCLQIEQEQLLDSLKEKEPRDFVYSILSSIQDRHRFYENVFLSDMNPEIFKMFHSFFHDFLSKILNEREKQGIKLAGPIPLLSAYYSNGLAGLTFWWLEHGLSYSIDDIAVCLFDLLGELLPD